MTIKLIGAGFGRTGTTSIKAALEELGIGNCYHMIEVLTHPSHVRFWDKVLDGQQRDWQQVLANYDAIIDWPGCTFYQELMAAYPDAKVLLTVRDPEKWYESAYHTIYKLPRTPTGRLLRLLVPHFRRFFAMNDRLIWDGTFGGNFEDRQHAMAVFQAHIEAVKQTVPADRLLIYDVSEGWEPLCNFLGVPVPKDKPFPRLNDRTTMRRMMQASIAAMIVFLVVALGLIWRFSQRTW